MSVNRKVTVPAGSSAMARSYAQPPRPVKRAPGARDRRRPRGRGEPGTSAQRLVQPADLEGAHDVGDAVHERPDAGEDEQQVGLVDEELTAGPEREDHHEDAGDQAEPPQ